MQLLSDKYRLLGNGGNRGTRSLLFPRVKIAPKQITFALFLLGPSSLENQAVLQSFAKEGPFAAELASR